MREIDDQDDDKTTPPGRRSGTGSASVVPFLVKSLAVKPLVPAQDETDSRDAEGNAEQDGAG